MFGDSPISDDDKYCADLVQRYDRDRFISALFAPDIRRQNLLALYAFNIEIAGTRESVTEPLIGQMRLKWWFDALGEIYAGSPPAHQVAVPLSRAVIDAKIDRDVLEKLIEARTLDLGDRPLATINDLVEYAGHTSGGLAEMALSILGVDETQAQKMCRSIGISYALIGMIRALPLNFIRRRVFLPTDVRFQTNLDVDVMFGDGLAEGAPSNLIDAINIIIECAKTHLKEAEHSKSAVQRQSISALMPAVLAKRHLAELAKCGNDPFKLPLRPPGPTAWSMLHMAWIAAKGRL